MKINSVCFLYTIFCRIYLLIGQKVGTEIVEYKGELDLNYQRSIKKSKLLLGCFVM